MSSKTGRFLSGMTFGILVAMGGCEGSGVGFTVMTQNVYYGFDVGPLMSASSPEEIPLLAAQAYQALVATNFAERADALADEIGRKRPALVALQEVALIRVQSPGDAVVGGTIPAETVVYDYLQILLDALAARGLSYRVAGKVQNVDVELPMVVSPDPTFDDIRLTDFDVVLVRKDVEVSGVVAANYQARALVPNLGLEIPRGYVALDARVGGRKPIRFVTTHLEDLPFIDVQVAQAQELATLLGAESKEVVLAGDFNSPAPYGEAVSYLASQGFVDTWTLNRRQDPAGGLTWGHDPDLRNPNDQFTIRIDLVFVRLPGAFPSVNLLGASTEVWGDDLNERTATGMWPSDHAGIVVDLRLP